MTFYLYHSKHTYSHLSMPPYNKNHNSVLYQHPKTIPTNLDIFVNCNWVNNRWQGYSTHNQYIEQHHNNRTSQITAQHNNNRKTIAQHNDNYF